MSTSFGKSLAFAAAFLALSTWALGTLWMGSEQAAPTTVAAGR